MPSNSSRTKRIAIGTIFGTLIFIFKVFIPTPYDKMFVGFEALLLALGSLIIRRMGATNVGAVGGLLMTYGRVEYAPFSLIFAVMYGALIDGLFLALRVRMSHRKVKTGGVIISLALSTTIVGLLSTYTIVSLELMPMIPFLYLIILLVGIANGAAAGYITSFLWTRYLAFYIQE
ncbi:MAG: hypothetical protein JSV58_04130 [Candidatus Bathyarchaeota archaeon]|nr:MAG: hypothetical protein JSV58_04130 [Candidatus Bathyarchaeota archaeon]